MLSCPCDVLQGDDSGRENDTEDLRPRRLEVVDPSRRLDTIVGMRVALVVCGLLWCAPALAAAPPTVLVHWYPATAVDRRDLASAEAEVAAIFGDALRFEWTVCRASGEGESPERCQRRLAGFELAIRLLSDSDAYPADALGVASASSHDRGTLATLFLRRVRAAAGRAGMNGSTLLGRVAAHELGHLLLGTGSHRPGGLMRARWSLGQLRRALDWRVHGADSHALRAAAERRRGIEPPSRLTAEVGSAPTDLAGPEGGTSSIALMRVAAEAPPERTPDAP